MAVTRILVFYTEKIHVPIKCSHHVYICVSTIYFLAAVAIALIALRVILT